ERDRGRRSCRSASTVQSHATRHTIANGTTGARQHRVLPLSGRFRRRQGRFEAIEESRVDREAVLDTGADECPAGWREARLAHRGVRPGGGNRSGEWLENEVPGAEDATGGIDRDRHVIEQLLGDTEGDARQAVDAPGNDIACDLIPTPGDVDDPWGQSR